MTEFRVKQIDHVELFVPEIREAADWYARTLGLQIVRRFEHWAQGGRGPLMVSGEDGNTMLALFRGEPQREREPVGYRRVAFRVDGASFFSFVSRLPTQPVHDEAGQVLTKLEPVDHGESFSLYFCDPWGNRLEITSYDVEPIRQELGSFKNRG